MKTILYVCLRSEISQHFLYSHLADCNHISFGASVGPKNKSFSSDGLGNMTKLAAILNGTKLSKEHSTAP